MSVDIQAPFIPEELEPKRDKRKKHREEKHERKRKRRDKDDGAEDSRAKRVRSGTSPDEQQSQSLSTTESVNNSPFYVHTVSLYLPVWPITQLNPLEGLCAEHLSPLLLTYYEPLDGVLLSYSNPRLSEHPTAKPRTSDEPILARAVAESAASFVWITAEFLVFSPRKGQWIEGWINLQNEGHLGIVCWNLFNASIERRRLPQDWTWSGVGGNLANGAHERTETNDDDELAEEDRGQGFFVDGSGNNVEGMIRFRVHDAETAFTQERGFVSIEGTMLDDEAEEQLAEQEQNEVAAKAHRFGRGGILRARSSSLLGDEVRSLEGALRDSLPPLDLGHRVSD